jgi:hypothetical protein
MHVWIGLPINLLASDFPPIDKNNTLECNKAIVDIGQESSIFFFSLLQKRERGVAIPFSHRERKSLYWNSGVIAHA